MTLICGIDEAGKGPLVGPLVIVGAIIDESKLDKLEAIGVKDSKLLTKQQREDMVFQIKQVLDDFKVIRIQPAEIDQAIDADKHMNLNWLEAQHTVHIIDALEPDKVIFDCPSPNIPAYTTYIKERLKEENVELIGEHNAERFPIVAAASIIAKTERDSDIEKIKKICGFDFNSGYPHDEKTKEFMQACAEQHPEFFRKSWATWKKHQTQKEQKKLGEY